VNEYVKKSMASAHLNGYGDVGQERVPASMVHVISKCETENQFDSRKHACQHEALKFVSLPVQILGNIFKMMLVMDGSKTVRRKSCKLVIVVLLILSAFLTHVLLWSVSTVAGQCFICSQLKEFGVVVLAATMKARQVVSILLLDTLTTRGAWKARFTSLCLELYRNTRATKFVQFSIPPLLLGLHGHLSCSLGQQSGAIIFDL